MDFFTFRRSQEVDFFTSRRRREVDFFTSRRSQEVDFFISKRSQDVDFFTSRPIRWSLRQQWLEREIWTSSSPWTWPFSTSFCAAVRPVSLASLFTLEVAIVSSSIKSSELA